MLNGRPGDAAAPIDAAAELAERFGSVDSLGYVFGPTHVASNRMWLALETDEPDHAVRVAQGADPKSAFPVNRSFYWIHSGRALAQLPGRQDDAVRALRTAQRIFPTGVLRNQGVREVLGEMLTRGSVRGTMGLELRGIAYRAGLLTAATPS